MPALTAFSLRDDDEGCLSVNWVEYFGTATLDSVKIAVTEAKRRTGWNIKPGGSGKYALLDVGGIRKATASIRKTRFKWAPLEEDRSHSTIEGYKANEDELMALALRAQVKAVIPAA